MVEHALVELKQHLGPHEQIVAFKESDNPTIEAIGIALAQIELSVDALSSLVMKARLHEVSLPPELGSVIKGLRDQLLQTQSVCPKPKRKR